MAIDDVPDAIAVVNAALTEGDSKYGKAAWRDNPTIAEPYARIEEHLAAADRHIKRHRKGEVVDPDSGRLALAHAVGRGLIALQSYINEFGAETLASQRLCEEPHPEFGATMACKLPFGHEGPHASMTGPDEHWTTPT